MIVSRDLFSGLFTTANVALHRALLSPGDPAKFWAQWDKYVVALEALEVAPTDQRYRDEHIEWFYDLAEFAGMCTLQRSGGPARTASGPNEIIRRAHN